MEISYSIFSFMFVCMVGYLYVQNLILKSINYYNYGNVLLNYMKRYCHSYLFQDIMLFILLTLLLLRDCFPIIIASKSTIRIKNKTIFLLKKDTFKHNRRCYNLSFIFIPYQFIYIIFPRGKDLESQLVNSFWQ
jgi:hypothetical protein